MGTRWGRVHVSCLRDAGVEVVALCGRDSGETRRTATDLGIAAATTTLADLARLDLDLVTVATPPATHADVVDALPDLPILCEKPAVGLAAPRELAPRTGPVRVNYAFGFLDVARRAGAALDRIGTVESARAISVHDLPERLGPPEDLFMELVPHPWAWLVQLLGPAAPASAGTAPHLASPPAAAVAVRARCGAVPVVLEARHDPGTEGIRHTVEIAGAQGRIRVHGQFRVGNPWRFDPPELTPDAGPPELLGAPESGPGDPWYRANARSVAAFVDLVRTGAPGPPFDWAAALAMDAAAQAALRGAGWPAAR